MSMHIVKQFINITSVVFVKKWMAENTDQYIELFHKGKGTSPNPSPMKLINKVPIK